jgi:dimethylaniline monooxygenase (N-oxide forming)
LNIFFFFLVNYLLNDFKLGLLLLFGPFTPYRYRLQGPNKWEGARQAILTQNER